MKECGVNEKEVRLTISQQRVVKLLFKFRFLSASGLGQVMGIRRASTYEALEKLVDKELVTRVYPDKYITERKPAYYYLNKSGVTAVRKLMDVPESVVHTHYKNDQATEEFVVHCQALAQLYVDLLPTLPDGTDVFTKAEINRFDQFPKNRPDLYVRTPDGQEAIVVLAVNSPLYVIRKRLDEIIDHSENEGWDGEYPRICFVLKNSTATHSFLYTSKRKLENMGMEDGELNILVTSLTDTGDPSKRLWANVMTPKTYTNLF